MEIELHPNIDGQHKIFRSALKMLKPAPNLKPSEWAERNIKIPEGNKIPGYYRVANAPIQRGPMDEFINPDCRRVSMMWGAQLGKTTCALAMQGYAIGQRPRSQMMMQPSQGDLKTWLETKFNPLVDASALGELIAKPRSREGVNNQTMKSYPGGFIMFAWAGSTKTMRGRSAPFIVCDEIDGYDETPEGDPVSLIWQRAATFGDDRFLVEISTPTLTGFSAIEDAFMAGDQRYFYVKCPDCGDKQSLKWGQIKWHGRKSEELHDWEKDDHDQHQPDTAKYCCEHCGSLWNDGQRFNAIRSAEDEGLGWIASRPFKGHASFHAWEGYSLFRNLSDIVQDYLDKIQCEDLQSFANVSLSRTYELKGDGCDPESLYSKREPFPDYTPDGVLYITLGADMQGDRLEYEIVGWGVNGESWSLEYKVLWGDPLEGIVFKELEDTIRYQRFQLRDGTELPISAAAIDTGGTGGYTQAAYDWLRGKTRYRIFGIKGYSPSFGQAVVKGVQRARAGRGRRHVNIYPVAVDEAKKIVYKRIAQTVGCTSETGPGFMHIPQSRPEEWFKQLTSESLLLQPNRKTGRKKPEWVKSPKTRNEALDCRVYAYAALRIMNPNLRIEKTKKQPKKDNIFDENGYNALENGEKPEKSAELAKPAKDEPPKLEKKRIWKPRKYRLF